MVGAVEQGHSLATALPRLAQQYRWDAAQRGAAQALSFATLRHLGTVRAQLTLMQRKPAQPALLRDLLHTALTLLLPDQRGAYAPHTVVDQAVEACKRTPELRHAARFANAMLRRASTTPPDSTQVPDELSDPAHWNYPDWWISLLRDAYPQDWRSVLEAGQRQPAMTLRINPRHQSRAAYQAALAAAGLTAHPPADTTLDQALVLESPVQVQRLPGFAEGDVSVQDASAQHAAALLQVQPGQRVLDACAAPGGKTAHILERTDCELLALDRDPERLHRVADTLQRLGLEAATRAADAAHPDTWWDGRPFDRILLDAPCSASGIDRRHPDIRWLRRASDIPALAHTQRELLDALWPLLAPGGRLVYATCSVFPQEGAEQAAAFLTRHPDAIASPAPGQILPREAPPETADRAALSQDGFFYAVFTKSS